MNRLMRLASLSVFIVCVAAHVPAIGAELPTSTPEAEGMSAEKLAKVGEIMKGLVEAKKISGGTVIVARNGKVVFDETYGQRDLERKLPIERDTIFRIYSMSKAITSAAALMLVDEGKLELDAPVSKYLPEFAEMKVVDGDKERPAKSPITVKDLFLHTSGIPYPGPVGSETQKLYDAVELLDMWSDLPLMVTKISQIPLEFDPGTKWKYGASIDVLGYLVQKVSGQPLEEFLQERIYEPLGMTDTAFYVPAEKQSRFAANYYSNGKGKMIILDDPTRSAYLRKRGLASGGGGLVGTASDYMRFLLMIEAGGKWQGKRLLSAESVERMRTNQLSKEVEWIGFGDEKSKGTGFGFGFAVTVEPGEKSSDRKDEYGWGGAASTHYWVSPNDRLVVVTMEQRSPNTPETEEKLKPVIYGAIEK
jgi:CubicO group peptidase (beta-lactamase class C family)